MESYKRLEKLCGEIYNENHGVSAYIDEMLSVSDGEVYVPEWNDRLKKLKHYRWVRNRIAHDPDCREEDMCDSDDAAWLEWFHESVMTGTDPLACYRRAKSRQKKAPIYVPRPSQPIDSMPDEDLRPQENDSNGGALKLIAWTVAAILAYVLFYFYNKGLQ